MSTNILSEINADELDFKEYYIKELNNPPMESFKEIEGQISELKLRMQNFITPSTLENMVFNSDFSLEDGNASALGIRIIPFYLTPIFI